MEEIVSAHGEQPLLLCVVRALQDRRVGFCYWKSSLHLAEALAGDKDFDLLVDPARAGEVEAVLAGLGLKPAKGGAELPGEAHWIGLDLLDGRLRHVHVQYDLYAGRPPVYELHLPWREHVLAHLVMGPSGVPVPEPELEAALLLARR
ncbi:MAG: hypothetical protein K8H88_34100, partial [Sandaracinaceae bacterium]|nr:hypothetical protein [Sandaracinaceae bacterium]